MYGLIHRAIRDCIKEAHGDASWEKVRRSAGADESQFVSMQAYPDEITFGLIENACKILAVEPDDLMHAFGRFWVLVTAKTHYGALLEFAGRDLLTMLENLDTMHEQVAISFVNLQQPSFEVERESTASVLLHYRSIRDGLSAFVLGLLSGLSEHFSSPVDVDQLESKADGADHDVFRVTVQS